MTTKKAKKTVTFVPTAPQRKALGTIVTNIRSAFVTFSGVDSADGSCMLGLYTAFINKIPCVYAVETALREVDNIGTKGTAYKRKSQLFVVAKAADEGKTVPFGPDRTPTTVGSLLATRTPTGEVKAGSLQGLYNKIQEAGKKPKSKQEMLDEVNEGLAQRIANKPELLEMFFEEKNIEHLRATIESMLEERAEEERKRAAKKSKSSK